MHIYVYMDSYNDISQSSLLSAKPLTGTWVELITSFPLSWPALK